MQSARPSSLFTSLSTSAWISASLVNPARCIITSTIGSQSGRGGGCSIRSGSLFWPANYSCFSTTTTRKHPHLRSVTKQDAEALKQILNANGDDTEHAEDGRFVSTVAHGSQDLRSDWTGKYHAPDETLVVQPSNVAQVAQVLRYCNQRAIGVVPVSGNTGLVGGSMPLAGTTTTTTSTTTTPTTITEILLSLRRLNQIESLSPISGIVKTQAGVILQTLQEYTHSNNWLLPLDLGAKGSCCVGGNIATNAGGSYYYRYGSLAANLIGLQVVTANGTILDLNYNCPVPKNNTGYKLHQLLVGSEGTLAVITGVALQCTPLLPNKQTAWLACHSFAQILQTVQLAQQCLGEILAAAEWMDAACVGLVAQTHPQYAIPLWSSGGSGSSNNDNHAHYLLIETHGSNVEHDAAKLDHFLEQALETNVVVDGVLAQDTLQQQTLWQIREAANPAAAATGYTYKYDLSLPDSQFESFIEELREQLRECSRGVAVASAHDDDDDTLILHNPNWGHVLDGNLHFNVVVPKDCAVHPSVLARLEPLVLEAVRRRGGSMSAEHGIGQTKCKYMAGTGLVHGTATLQVMRAIKQVWDPKGILNTGKVLPMDDDDTM